MDKKILIIGAGASGIAAATKLYENGFKNFIILEGENRIGGRIHTIPFGDNVIDMGAQWCHGERGNVVYEMAAPLGLVKTALLDTADGFEYRYFNGEVADKIKTGMLDELAFKLSEDGKEIKKYSGSFGAFIKDRFVFGCVSKTVDLYFILILLFTVTFRKSKIIQPMQILVMILHRSI